MIRSTWPAEIGQPGTSIKFAAQGNHTADLLEDVADASITAAYTEYLGLTWDERIREVTSRLTITGHQQAEAPKCVSSRQS